jgi:hypothetical protein
MLRHGKEAHDAEQSIQLARVGMAELDELEAVGAHRVLGRDGWRRGVVWKGTHRLISA